MICQSFDVVRNFPKKEVHFYFSFINLKFNPLISNTYDEEDFFLENFKLGCNLRGLIFFT